MSRSITRAVFFFLLLSMNAVLFAQDRLVTLATARARVLGMAGAFLSVRDELGYLDQNPSAAERKAESGFRIAVNPLGFWSAFHDSHSWSDWTVPVGLTLRKVEFYYRKLVVGALFGEESLSKTQRLTRRDPFDVSGYQGSRNTSYSAAVFISPRLSLGAGMDIFHRNNSTLERSWGYRYGITLSPRDNLSIGIAFFDLPNDHGQDRMPLESFGDESLNIGVSYRPWTPILVSVDVRNVSENQSETARQPRAGIEIAPFRHAVLRGGWAKYGTGELISVGFGFFDWNAILPESMQSSGGRFGLEAALIYEKTETETNRWIVASCLVRL